MTGKRIRRAAMALGLVGAASLFCVTEAQAITISINASLLGANSPDNSDTSNPRAQNLSAVSTVNAGGSVLDEVGNFVSGVTRYTSVTAADADAFSGGSITRNATHSYRATITVTPDIAATVYDLTLDTSRLGALVIRDEGGSEGRARIDAVNGLINGASESGLGLAGLPQINSGSTRVEHINQSNTFTLAGLTGPQVFEIDFTWTSMTYSGNNIIQGSDEAVVLLGMQGTISQIGAADDYPGTSGRTNGLAEDGHWLTATATVTAVPEPSTWVLCVLGGMGLAYVAKRRRS